MASLKTLAPACLALALVAPTAPAFAQPRLPIAFISVQKIISEAEDAKAAAKELEALRNAKAQELTAKKKQLDATKLELANAGGFFSATKRAQLQEKVRKEESDLLQANQQAQVEFQERQRKLQDTLRVELTAIVTAIAAQRGIRYVLNHDAAVVLAPHSADLTGELR